MSLRRDLPQKGGECRVVDVFGNCRSERYVGSNPVLRLQVARQTQLKKSTVVIVNLQND